MCRAPEFTVDLVGAMSGLSGAELAALTAAPRPAPARLRTRAIATSAEGPLRLVHLNQCDQLGPVAARTLRDALPAGIHVIVD